MKGQAFIVFRDLAGATSALRSLDGEIFYEKQMVRLSLFVLGYLEDTDEENIDSILNTRKLKHTRPYD